MGGTTHPKERVGEADHQVIGAKVTISTTMVAKATRMQTGTVVGARWQVTNTIMMDRHAGIGLPNMAQQIGISATHVKGQGKSQIMTLEPASLERSRTWAKEKDPKHSPGRGTTPPPHPPRRLPLPPPALHRARGASRGVRAPWEQALANKVSHPPRHRGHWHVRWGTKRTQGLRCRRPWHARRTRSTHAVV